MKRYRSPKMKPGLLQVYYGRVDGEPPGICYQYGGSGADRCDSHLMHGVFGSPRLELCFSEEDRRKHGPYKWGPTLIQELEKRGYDISTLRFSIEQKRAPETETAQP